MRCLWDDPLVVGHAVVDITRKILGARVLKMVLLGSGDGAEWAIQQLTSGQTTTRVLVADTTHARALETASRVHGSAIAFAAFREELLDTTSSSPPSIRRDGCFRAQRC